MDTQMRKEYAKVIAKAWTDSAFKDRLLQDPATVLKENGILVSDDMTCFTLPDVPAGLLHEPIGEMNILGCAAE